MPKIFECRHQCIGWCARQQGASSVEHYLDDYIVLGPPASSQCQADLQTLESVCGELRVPLASHKSEGPTTCLTFLGIEIDSVVGSLTLPAEKLHRLVSTRENWGDRKECTCKELESLIRQLNVADATCTGSVLPRIACNSYHHNPL